MTVSFSVIPVVTRDATRCKHLFFNRESSLKKKKRSAHREHRRHVRQFFHVMVMEGYEDPAELEPRFKRLHTPRLTAYDIS